MSDSNPRTECPICRARLKNPLLIHGRNQGRLSCGNCGDHGITEEAFRFIDVDRFNEMERAGIAHQVCRLNADGLITQDMLTHWASNCALPSAMERVDALVLMLSELQPGHGHIFGSEDRARLGCADFLAVVWLRDQAVTLGLVEPLTRGGFALSIEGWKLHRELLRNGINSEHAFMAMAFNPEMWALFAEHLKPAVAAADFDLRPVAGAHQTAGSIDNRMRVEIRTSRFMVCDLTHNNRGAYWEAGFAEGLGRPVFYICRRDVLTSTDPAIKPHFDTAHQLIIPWALDTIREDMQQLTAAIRATLPAEARQADR